LADLGDIIDLAQTEISPRGIGDMQALDTGRRTELTTIAIVGNMQASV